MVYLDSEQRVSIIDALSGLDSAETAIVCLGLDNLTAFRREYGFELADKVLSHVHSVALEVLQASLLVHNLDDLLIGLLPTTSADALDRVERLRQRIGGSKLRFTVDGEQIAQTVTLSAGLAPCPPGTSVELSLGKVAEAWCTARSVSNSVMLYKAQDPLTGLPCASSVYRNLQTVIWNAGPDAPLSLIQLDIDAFGDSNDQFGKHAADDALSVIGNALTDAFGEEAIVGRTWSDEFLVILPNTRTEDAAFLAEGLRRQIADRESPIGPIGLSLGVAGYPRHASDARELIRKTREALYLSKESGGGQTTVAEADQMTTKTSHFSKIQLKRLAALAKQQDRSEAALLREGLDALLQVYQDGAPTSSLFYPSP